jgi:hypothetical protein
MVRHELIPNETGFVSRLAKCGKTSDTIRISPKIKFIKKFRIIIFLSTPGGEIPSMSDKSYANTSFERFGGRFPTFDGPSDDRKKSLTRGPNFHNIQL